jgi:DNA-binding NarL/FixJ family response regulator
VALAQLDEAIAEFEAMQMQPALARARELRTRAGAATTPRSANAATYPDGLSLREVEVLRLIAAGYTNREIADRLVVSVRTVERHAVNIYAKTGTRGRTDAVAYAHRHGLHDPVR